MKVRVQITARATEDNGMFKAGYVFHPTTHYVDAPSGRLYEVIKKLAAEEITMGYNMGNRAVTIEIGAE